MANWNNPEYRKQVIRDLKSEENLRRKRESLAQFEVYSDRMLGYVKEYLRQQIGSRALEKMPIISSVNLARRIVQTQATVYRRCPEREFEGASEETAAILQDIYEYGRFDYRLQKVNAFYKLQNQACIYVKLEDGYICPKLILPHQYDVIPDDRNPEKADSYIISTFDKSFQLRTDGTNQESGDPDDYQVGLEKYIVWSKDYNFIMDRDGNILSEETDNPIGVLPFVDLSIDKDWEFFVRQGDGVVDFTVQYNAALSDLALIVRLQGYAQAVYTGPANLMPEQLDVGPNTIIRLPIDPSQPTNTTFEFKNASPDITGSIAQIEQLLANFLTSRGLEPNVISGNLNSSNATYSSGIERLLAMLDQFEATREDFNAFEYAEQQMFEIVKAYVTKYSRTDLLNKKLWISESLDNVEIEVKYHSPEMIQTEAEKIANIQARLDAGLINDVEAIAADRGVTYDRAKQLKEELGLGMDLTKLMAPLPPAQPPMQAESQPKEEVVLN